MTARLILTQRGPRPHHHCSRHWMRKSWRCSKPRLGLWIRSRRGCLAACRWATTARERLDNLGTVRARLGVTPLPTFLLYGRADLPMGALIRHKRLRIRDRAFLQYWHRLYPSSGSRSSMLTGWTAGGGGEWAFAPNISVKAEYLHYDLGTMHYSANQITSISAPCVHSRSSDLRLALGDRVLRP